jgi:hypothetical protein
MPARGAFSRPVVKRALGILWEDTEISLRNPPVICGFEGSTTTVGGEEACQQAFNRLTFEAYVL